MEILLAIVIVVVGLAVYFNRKPKPTVNPCEDAPYKVETPAEAPTPVAEKASEAMVESVAPAKKPRAKKPAAAKTAKKPAAKKTTRTKKSV